MAKQSAREKRMEVLAHNLLDGLSFCKSVIENSGTKHTPGPWTVEDPMEHELWIVQANKQAYEWRCIASIPSGDLEEGFPQEVCKANARMILAAPSLYEALKALLDISPFAKSDADRQIHDQAQVAIAMAEGKK